MIRTLPHHFVYLDAASTGLAGAAVYSVWLRVPGATTVERAAREGLAWPHWLISAERVWGAAAEAAGSPWGPDCPGVLHVFGPLHHKDPVCTGSIHIRRGDVVHRHLSEPAYDPAAPVVRGVPRNPAACADRGAITRALEAQLRGDTAACEVRKLDDCVTVVSGDGALAPLVSGLVAEGFRVHVAWWGHVSEALRRAATRFIDLDPLVEDLHLPWGHVMSSSLPRKSRARRSPMVTLPSGSTMKNMSVAG